MLSTSCSCEKLAFWERHGSDDAGPAIINGPDEWNARRDGGVSSSGGASGSSEDSSSASLASSSKGMDSSGTTSGSGGSSGVSSGGVSSSGNNSSGGGSSSSNGQSGSYWSYSAPTPSSTSYQVGYDGGMIVALDCTACHGSVADNNPAPPRDVFQQVGRDLRTVGAHREHLTPNNLYRTVRCDECHVVPTVWDAPGHIDPSPAELTWGPIASARSTVSSWDGANCTTYCHGAKLRGGTLTTPAWTVTTPLQVYCGSCHGFPPSGHPASAATQGCTGCHPFNGFEPLDPQRHVDGILDVTGGGCGSCHALPPNTAGHRTHAVGADPVYGGLGTAADQVAPTSYALGCGHCHPLDGSKHINGTLEVELFDVTAPPGSWKAKSPSVVPNEARYVAGPNPQVDEKNMPFTDGTCSNVACHSGKSTLAPTVPVPGTDFTFTTYPMVYPAYVVTRPDFYRSAVWGSTLTCAGCHDYPPKSTFPQNQAGAGDSHSFIDANGRGNLHMFNHAVVNDPIPCRACHYSTVHEVATFTRDAQDVATFADIAIVDVKKHVNGQADVAINPAEVVTMFGKPYPLNTMTYDATNKTCNNAACHLNQTSVKWGTPLRTSNVYECNSCHRY
jgi:predicted CxxxxCH...CXXCH cytochrome family protein